MARTRAFTRRLGAAACSAKIVVLVLVGTAASLVASASAVHAASARPVNPDVGMYGDPTAAAPYWRQQRTSDCGEMAVADVVGQITGDEPDEQRITALAESTPSGVARRSGTSPRTPISGICGVARAVPDQGRQHSDKHRGARA